MPYSSPDPKLTPYAFALYHVRLYQKKEGNLCLRTLDLYHEAIETLVRTWGP